MSCEIEDSSKLVYASRMGYFDRAYYRFLCDLFKDVQAFLRGTKSDSCGTQWVYKYMAVDMYATVLYWLDVILLTENDSKHQW